MDLYGRVSRLLWRHPSFKALPSDAKVVVLAIMSGPQALLVPGIIESDLLTLAGASGIAPDVLEVVIAQMEQSGDLEVDRERSVMRVPWVPLFDRPASHTVLIGAYKTWHKLPESPLKYRHIVDYQKAVDFGVARMAETWASTFGPVKVPAAWADAVPGHIPPHTHPVGTATVSDTHPMPTGGVCATSPISQSQSQSQSQSEAGASHGAGGRASRQASALARPTAEEGAVAGGMAMCASVPEAAAITEDGGEGRDGARRAAKTSAKRRPRKATTEATNVADHQPMPYTIAAVLETLRETSDGLIVVDAFGSRMASRFTASSARSMPEGIRSTIGGSWANTRPRAAFRGPKRASAWATS